MKTLVTYSSKTGNTGKVATAIHQAIPDADIFPMEQAPDPNDYDLVFAGFWVDKGTADQKAGEYLHRICGKPVALFATLGAYPDSDHARESLDNAAALIPSCTVLDRFICQGAIDPKLISWMSQLPPEHPHAPDAARIKRWKDAESHPDETDLHNARIWAARVYHGDSHTATSAATQTE